uniref:Caskin-1-like n=1 Tax=Phallusia mammillata TaxID=59560 RepID=A0A6F9D7T0_9ASCI|nr:caskin-1-like [Phallusia mammillata]
MGKGEELLEAVRLQDLSTAQKILNRGKGKILGSKKINVNYQNNEGTTALHQAALVGSSDIMCLLLDSRAQIDIQDRKGNTPLHYCAWQGKSEQVATLLQCGANHSLKASNGITPLHLASQYGHITACKMLLQYGADPIKQNLHGHTCLDLACEFGRLEVVELLLNCQFGLKLIEPYLNYSHENEYSHTTSPLHLAAKNGHGNVIRALLQAGMNINWRCPSGTCLHEAVTHGKLDVVQLLVDCGIDTSITNTQGQTALDIVKGLPQTHPTIDMMKILSLTNSSFLQVYAVNDFKNVYDKSSLAFTRGTIITVVEQNASGNWKGRIDNLNGIPSVGYFPSAYVRPIDQDDYHASIAGSDDSGIHPYDEEVNFTCHPTSTMYTYPISNLPTSHHVISNASHKYVNMEPHVTASPPHASRKHVIPNVNNPSYDDVIFSQQVQNKSHLSVKKSNAPTQPIETIPVSKPLIANPGYEDVLIDCSSVSVSISGKASNVATQIACNHKPLQNQALPSTHSAVGPLTATNRTVVQGSGKASKSEEEVLQWLQSIHMEDYCQSFLSHGYDMVTISYMNPSDLSALNIFNPDDRSTLSSQIHVLRSTGKYPKLLARLPNTVDEWLSSIGLLDYMPIFKKHGILSIERLTQTSWEDLQDLKINKLGHQKKITIAIKELLHLLQSVTVRTSTSPVSQPQNTSAVLSSPSESSLSTDKQVQVSRKMSNLKPSSGYAPPVSVKPGTKPKPKTMASFHENPGLSLELQKALNRRQKVIDDASGSEPKSPAKETSVEPKQVTPSSYVAHSQPNAYVVSKVDVIQPSGPSLKATTPSPQTRKQGSHHRGPPPSPPKRTTSVSADDGSAEVVPDKQLPHIPVQNHHHPVPVVAVKKPGVAPKPTKPEKPQINANKPNVMKKPTAKPKPMSQLATNQVELPSPPKHTLKTSPVHGNAAQNTQSIAPKSPLGNVGNRFDLSVLDQLSPSKPSLMENNQKPKVEKQPFPGEIQEPFVKKQTFSSGNRKPNEKQPFPKESRKPVVKNQIPTVKTSGTSSHNTISFHSPAEDFQWPAPPPPLDVDLPDPEPLPEVMSDHETCFEEDIDTGTVKRRPASINLLNEVHTPSTSEQKEKKMNEAVKTAHQVNKTPDIPTSQVPVLPPKTARKSDPLPPPVPAKLGKKQTQPLDIPDSDEELQNTEARKVLDDIGSMFDDLVNEFDEILG